MKNVIEICNIMDICDYYSRSCPVFMCAVQLQLLTNNMLI